MGAFSVACDIFYSIEKFCQKEKTDATSRLDNSRSSKTI